MPGILNYMTNDAQQILATLQQELALDDNLVTEAELLQQLELRVSQLLSSNAETFFQLMYRLDIPEKAMNEALLQADVPGALARLIYQRQLQKIQSRRQYKTDDNTDTDLRW